jgi:mRNA deadenylase 3'-5' endonuclease subunit Ccr4
MRHIKRLICIVVWNSLTLASIANAQTEQNKKADSRVIELMTYNLKYASPTFKPSWEVRREMQVDMIRKYNPDIIGTQEGLKEQVDY